jgi:hypothetical protein
MEKLTNGSAFIRRLYDRILVPTVIMEEGGFREAQPEDDLQGHEMSFSGIAGQILKGSRRELLARAEARAMLDEWLHHRRINERIYERRDSSLREA